MKKSIVISLLTVACIIGIAIRSLASTGIVTTDTLRLRKEPSTNSSILALLSEDDKVEIIGEEKGWYKVRVGEGENQKEGYVAEDYIKVLEEKETPAEEKVEEESNNIEETNTEEENKKIENEEENVTENQEENISKKIIPSETKIYMTPVINSVVLNTVNEETEIQVVCELKGWSYIKFGKTIGWVRTESIKEEAENKNSSLKTGYISGASVNFREEANTSSNIISKLTRNTELKIIEELDGWSKVEANGNIGYVSNQYISDKKVTTSRSSVDRTAKAKTNTTDTSAQKEPETDTASQGNATGSEIVAYAKKYLGYKYVYGGSTPSGFDCSGFTSYVYKHFGYSLSRSSSAQASNGKAVSKANLQVGDIICFARSSGSKTVGHVGIYIGGGKFIHAANSRKGVIISNVDGDGFYYVCARRII